MPPTGALRSVRRSSQFQKPYSRALPTIEVAGEILGASVLTALLLISAYLYADAPLGLSDRTELFGSWTIGELIAPLSPLIVHIVNRQHGPDRAFAALIGGVLLTVLFLTQASEIAPLLGTLPQTSLSWIWFVVSYGLANSVGIIVFEARRGPQWWSAPFWAALVSSVLLSAIYYPVFLATGHHLLSSALQDSAFFAGISIGLLLPFWLLRPLTRPMPGLNGY